jgi:hypothetical protein
LDFASRPPRNSRHYQARRVMPECITGCSGSSMMPDTKACMEGWAGMR